MTVYADHTHLGRHVTGLERITLELFSPDSLAPIEIVPVTATDTARMIATQTFGFPARLFDPSSILLCPGFPPTPLLAPFAGRVIPYIHDLFLMSRPQDLSTRAKLYMAQPFRLAVRHYSHFLVNSLETRRALAAACRNDAKIVVYRPKVRNVFGLAASARERLAPSRLRLVSLGTVEPRKNYLHAARILAELRRTEFPDATLEIIGRNGWGGDWAALEGQPGVTLCGYQSAAEIKHRLENADAFLCTSHEEGLGLPLLEAQYAGCPIIAPDAAIFREVLAGSGMLIDRTDASAAARTIASEMNQPDVGARFMKSGAENLLRWNTLAESDRDNVVELIASIARRAAQSPRHSSHTASRSRP